MISQTGEILGLDALDAFKRWLNSGSGALGGNKRYGLGAGSRALAVMWRTW